MIIIKNGALVTPQGLRRADLAMEGDKIVRIAAAIEPGEDDTVQDATDCWVCLLYTSPSPRDLSTSRMPSSA